MIMTTKTPSAVKSSPDGALEKTAYAAVAGIPGQEPHDLDRLGFCIYLFLKNRKDPLELAVRASGARLKIGEQEAVQRIRTALQGQGISA